MSTVAIYANLLRAALGAAVVYHIYKKEYELILPALAVVVLTFVPAVLLRFFSFQIAPAGNFIYLSVICMTIYLGSSLKFYDRFAWWDYVIHFLSGCLFVSVGVALASEAEIAGLQRFHILLFGLTLSLSVQALWEVVEYLCDCFFHTDAQRWQKRSATHNHKPGWAMQPAGLVDTMNDIIISILGALTAGAVWWFVG